MSSRQRGEPAGAAAGGLSRFTLDQLLEEVIRRRNAEPRAQPKHWCHDCAHFEPWDARPRRGDCPDSFNPCTKRHAMKFEGPETIDDEYGFYRNVCADRSTPIEEGGEP